jgi:tetratricopeptide (TPR) repeat protein
LAADDETLEMLRSLGYVASGRSGELPRTVDAEMSFDGFDPSDLALVSLAGRDLENGFVEKAEEKLARFFVREEALGRRTETAALRSLGHQNAAKAALSRGESERAAGEYEKALAEEASNPDAAEGIVYAWNLAGRPDVGEKRGRELRRARPADERLRLHCALSLALMNRRDEAIIELTRLAEDSRDSELAGVAAIYAEKLGGSEAGEYLETYLGAETPTTGTDAPGSTGREDRVHE